MELSELIKLIHTEASKLSFIPRIMEICGTHTVAIHRYGLKAALQGAVEFISGPGCPVCVSPKQFIEDGLECAEDGRVIATFGDMLRVPGSNMSLLEARSNGLDIRAVASPIDVLELALSNRDRKVTFLAVGFETTSPGTAILIEEAIRLGVGNLTVLTAHRLIPPALEVLLQNDAHQINGLLGPGHVGAIIGIEPFQLICRKYNIPCVISGFKPEDILRSVLGLIVQLRQGNCGAEIQYQKAVRPGGNRKALDFIDKYFEVKDAPWRGLGFLSKSGLYLKREYFRYDENLNFPDGDCASENGSGCCCGDILRGVLDPKQCPAFATDCSPTHPVGPCMVSSEGTCRAVYDYGGGYYEKNR